MIHFGPYILIQKIAQGGMAELYLAKSTKLNGLEKYLVIKSILPEYSSATDLIEMFVNEAKVNMNMSHNNVGSIFDFGVEGGRFYIAMDYIQGLNLASLQKKLSALGCDRLELSEVVYVISKAAEGLNYAHNCKDMVTNKPLNIIHRDVSPDNIMISMQGEVKVIDFGVASNQESKNTDKLKRVGKFSYMSPEQARGETLNLQSDVFSLGIVLWEMLTGLKFYDADSRAEVFEQAKRADIKDISSLGLNLPERLIEITNKALEPSLEKRYQTMKDFYLDLNVFLNTTYPCFTTELLKEKVSLANEEKAKEMQSIIENTVCNSTEFTSSKVIEKTLVEVAKERRKIKAKKVTRRKVRKKKAS